MKIKESEQLKMLATESGKTANQVSETIVTELINKQIIENISDNWGFPVADCYERDVTVVEMVDVIRAIGISPIRSVHLDALLECVLIGDDDCPECGNCYLRQCAPQWYYVEFQNIKSTVMRAKSDKPGDPVKEVAGTVGNVAPDMFPEINEEQQTIIPPFVDVQPGQPTGVFEIIPGMTVEEMTAMFFDEKTLIEPPYKVWQLNSKGHRYYYRAYDLDGLKGKLKEYIEVYRLPDYFIYYADDLKKDVLAFFIPIFICPTRGKIKRDFSASGRIIRPFMLFIFRGRRSTIFSYSRFWAFLAHLRAFVPFPVQQSVFPSFVPCRASFSPPLPFPRCVSQSLFS
jgi:hypothetical protein